MTNKTITGVTEATVLSPTDFAPMVTAGGSSRKWSFATLGKMIATGVVALAAGTLVASAPMALTQTWNNGAVIFTAIDVNITATARHNDSKFIDLRRGGSSQFYVTQWGDVQADGTFTTYDSFAFTENSEALLWRDGKFGWSSSTNVNAQSNNMDLVLRRDAANILAQRNGANGQKFRVYGAYTDAANYERLEIDFSGTSVNIYSQAAGTGTIRPITLSGTTVSIAAQGSSPIQLLGSGAGIWSILSTGHLVVDNDNTHDIGASGARRPRHIYAGGNIYAGSNGNLGWSGASLLQNAADGVITLYNNAGTSFGRLQFGGTTSSFPAIKRNGAAIDFVLANDSGYANVNAGVLAAAGTVSSGGGAGVAMNANISIPSAGAIVWGGDVVLWRDAANVLALREGTNAQSYRVYNTWTDASNYERAAISWSGGDLIIGVEKAGTGTQKQVHFRGESYRFYVGSGASVQAWNITAAGHLIAPTDNTYDIGASGATRPRDLFLGRALYAADNGNFIGTVTAAEFRAANYYYGFASDGSRGWIHSPSNGVFTLLDAATTSFGRLQFGGTTASFPALKRSSTILQSRLADDSDFAPLQGQLRVHANAVAETPTPTHTLRIFDAGGTEYKVTAIAA